MAGVYLARRRLLSFLVVILMGGACFFGGEADRWGERSLPVPCCSSLQFGPNSEAGDTAVQDAVLVAAYCAVVEGRVLPKEYGMFTFDGDQRIGRMMEAYVARARRILEGAKREERIYAIWGDDWGVNLGVETKDCDDSGLAPER